MAFNGNEGTAITLADAADWTKRYREAAPEGATLAHFYGKNKLLEILNQEDCMGIRVYFGTEPNNTESLVLVGADADEDDMTAGVIIDRSIRCPPMCSSKGPLNS